MIHSNFVNQYGFMDTEEFGYSVYLPEWQFLILQWITEK
jgi:hypothetical protein